MISIAERLRPFSHRPNTVCLIPGTEYLVRAFPALVRIQDLSGKVIQELALEIKGPLKQFTVLQDLERGCVTVFSECYRLHVLPNLEIIFQKNPHLPPLTNQERLSLGSHKKQEWEAVVKRCDFKEIFPIWFRLGSLLDLAPYMGGSSGIFQLLEACREAIQSKKTEQVIPHFKRLFLAGFGKMCVPRQLDEDHQGILPRGTEPSTYSPLYLLSEGAKLIRSLFIALEGNQVSILPFLPPEFFAGRMLHLKCGALGTLAMEWSKKSIRRLCFYAEQNAEITFRFQTALRRFRLRHSQKERGKEMECGDSLEIKSGSLYLLDQFKK